ACSSQMRFSISFQRRRCWRLELDRAFRENALETVRRTRQLFQELAPREFALQETEFVASVDCRDRHPRPRARTLLSLIEYCRATASVAINFGRRSARPTIHFKPANSVGCAS